MGSLEGRVALVTGAGRGIGEATARALAAAGAKVIATGTSAPAALAEEIGGIAASQDVTNEDDWVSTMALTREQAGGLDILVNNAGRFFAKAVTETSLEEWRLLHAVNVEGVFLGCKHAIPLLSERAPRWRGGAAIVNLSSVSGLVGVALAVCYNSTKGAVRLLSKGLAMELAPAQIRVNSVHPGVIQTDMADQLVSEYSGATGVGGDDLRDQFTQSHPLGRFGQPTNIADAIVFLASDSAAFMTGTELVVDGGFTSQ